MALKNAAKCRVRVMGTLVLCVALLIHSTVPGLAAASKAREIAPLGQASHGTVSQVRADLKGAIHHYRQARIADPNDVRLDERLLVAEQEYQAEANLSRLFTTHFVVAYPSGISPRHANRVADRLELVYQAVGRRFASFPNYAFTVVLYPDRQFHAATFSPAWARGLFDGKIRLLVEPDAPVADGVLIHEYVHAIVHHLGGGRVPVWLSEGLALYFDGGHQSWSRRAASDSMDYLPLTMLHADLVALPARSARTAYRQSYDATRALLARYGFIRMRQLLEQASQAPDFANAFEAALGQRYIEFERRWIAEREGKGF